jgi:hypothetical protein
MYLPRGMSKFLVETQGMRLPNRDDVASLDQLFGDMLSVFDRTTGDRLRLSTVSHGTSGPKPHGTHLFNKVVRVGEEFQQLEFQVVVGFGDSASVRGWGSNDDGPKETGDKG